MKYGAATATAAAAAPRGGGLPERDLLRHTLAAAAAGPTAAAGVLLQPELLQLGVQLLPWRRGSPHRKQPPCGRWSRGQPEGGAAVEEQVQATEEPEPGRGQDQAPGDCRRACFSAS